MKKQNELMARIKKVRVKDIAARVVRRPQPKRTAVIVRTGRKDVKAPEYGFVGKADLWSFTLERPAKRSNVRTGTVIGETMILEDVRVDAAVYRRKIIGKDCVFQLTRQKMWWVHKGARYTTVRGTRVPCGTLSGDKRRFHAKQGASVQRQDSRYFFSTMEHGRTQRSSTDVYSRNTVKSATLSSTSWCSLRPDLNVDDLAFFHSLQTDVTLVAKENRRELLAAVQKCWEEYPLEKTESVWSCLYGSFSGILETGGDNECKRHRGSRSAHSLSSEHGDLHDQLVPRRLVTGAKKKLAEMRAEQERGDDIPETAETDDFYESDSDSE